MKTKLVLIAAVFAALVSSAQTNNIIFPQLLSPTNSVLMTNAEFRTFSGNKIFFKNDAGYKSFRAADLDTNVLAALHLTAAQLDAKQATLDAAQRNYEIQLSTAQKQAAIAQAKADQVARNKAAFLQQNSQPQSMYGTGYDATNASRKGWDGKNFHDNQSQGNFIGNWKVKTKPQSQSSRFDDMMRKISLIKPTKPKKNAKRKK